MNANNSPDAVRALAYQLWLDRGGAGGSPEDDWLRAEEILSDEHRAELHDSALDQVNGVERRKAVEKLDKAVEESFPASDPPAVHLKDEPPVNASDKWEAASNAKRTGKRNGGAIV